jgi:hypothetical protein
MQIFFLKRLINVQTEIVMCNCTCKIYKGKEKGKAVPVLISWRLMGGWMYRSTSSRPWHYAPAALPPGPIRQEAGWAPESVWRTWRRFLTLSGPKLRPLDRPDRSQSLYRLSLHERYITLIKSASYIWNIIMNAKRRRSKNNLTRSVGLV